MVFQNPALYPHLTAYDNMAFGLRLRHCSKAEIARRVQETAEMLGLVDCLDRRPMELSGGQRQRVAIGRAIVRAPKVFLFDEPLSNLDAALRGQTRVEIAKLHRELGATTIYVTHDQVEAMTLADRVVVLRDGAIEQVGSPLELYDRPANQFVAQFIGTPRMNIVDSAALPALREAAGVDGASDGFIGVRPENVLVRPAGSGRLAGRVELVESLGADTLIYANVGDGNAAARAVQLVARQNERTSLQPGDAVGLDIVPASFHLFDRQGRVVSGRAA
jgi:multiple sugar transport system ATP-binding protein